MITRTITFDDLTPDDLAILFSEMDNRSQAKFFNALKLIADKWPGAGWCQQSSAIVMHLDSGGRFIIAKLAEWAADPASGDEA